MPWRNRDNVVRCLHLPTWAGGGEAYSQGPPSPYPCEYTHVPAAVRTLGARPRRNAVPTTGSARAVRASTAQPYRGITTLRHITTHYDTLRHVTTLRHYDISPHYNITTLTTHYDITTLYYDINDILRHYDTVLRHITTLTTHYDINDITTLRHTPVAVNRIAP